MTIIRTELRDRGSYGVKKHSKLQEDDVFNYARREEIKSQDCH
jgi:hypothetical protein